MPRACDEACPGVRTEPSPAVVALLAGRSGRDGIRATLLDLGARGWFSLRQPGILIGRDMMQLSGPVVCVLAPGQDDAGMLSYERRAARYLSRWAGTRGEFPADTLPRDLAASELRAFRGEVAADARARGLITPAPWGTPRWMARRDRLTDAGHSALAVRRARYAGSSRPAVGVERDVAYAAALGAAPLASFAHRRRHYVQPFWSRPAAEFFGQVLRQWEVDQGSVDGIAHFAAIDDGARTWTLRASSHVFEALTPGLLVHVRLDQRRDTVLAVSSLDH